jgi:hypothetical protein
VVWGETYTFLDSAVGFDIDDISHAVAFHVCAESDHALQFSSVSSIIPYAIDLDFEIVPSGDVSG